MTAGPTIFLDRDGTIIVDRHYLADPEGVELETGALEGLVSMAAMGCRLIGVTNQSGVAKGFFDRKAVERVNGKVDALLAVRGVRIARWYVCPHDDQAGCDCRKPAPGLLHEAARDFGIALAGSFVIGDKLSDVDLVTAIGGHGILVRTGKGDALADAALARGHAVAADLRGAAAIIARSQRDEPVRHG